MGWTIKQALRAMTFVAAVAMASTVGHGPARAAGQPQPAKKVEPAKKQPVAGKASVAKPAAAKPQAAATKPSPSASRAASDARNVAPPKKKKRISDAQLGQLYLLESQAGLRTKASATPLSQQLVGPPLSDREKVIHVLNRLAYGPKPGEVNHVLEEVGVDNWIKQQVLEPEKIDDKALEEEVAKRFKWTKMSLTQIREEYPIDRGQESQEQLRRELPESILFRAAKSNRQFKEVICEFWRNHFCINQPYNDAPTRSWTAVHYEEHVIRKHAFGKFGDMLFASARHPAMLEYLDNYTSRANAWNENYAREVMELHTLGADRHYNERDVLELSKVLTGWTYDEGLSYTFRQDWHQPGNKLVLGATIPQGKQGGEQVLYNLATHRGTADFISEKLCRYLVNDNPPPALVKKVSGVFRQSKGDLPKAYWAIVSSPEFMSRASYRAKFKTPFEFTVSALRTTGAELNEGKQTCDTLAKMGQALYNCDDPTGYYDTAEAWMDAGVLTSRWEYAWQLVRGSVPGVKVSDNLLAHFDKMKPVEAKEKLIERIINAEIGVRTREAVEEAAPEGTPKMLSILLGSPDFQQQ